MPIPSRCSVLVSIVGTLALVACGPSNGGIQGSNALSHPDVPGTIFTIVFENHNGGDVLTSSQPFLVHLANTYGSAAAYLTAAHPSLSNYLLLTSAQTFGVGDDGPPSSHSLTSTQNLADQLDAAHVPWRAYMESMGDACKSVDDGQYIVHHDPFVYYTSMSGDPARCRDRVVDFDQNFAADLASDRFRFMWITPNICHDMHNCDARMSDAWLSVLIPEIMASPGYRRGGVIFLLWDEGSLDFTYAESYLFHGPQNVAAIVVSPNLVASGFVSQVTYGHDSYLATVEDILGLPRLPTTANATPMRDFFREADGGP